MDIYDFIKNFRKLKGIILFCFVASILTFYTGKYLISDSYIAGFFSNISASFVYAIITLLIIESYIKHKKDKELELVNYLVSNDVHNCISSFVKNTFEIFKVFPEKKVVIKEKGLEFFTPDNKKNYIFFRDVIQKKFINGYSDMNIKDLNDLLDAIYLFEIELNDILDKYLTLFYPKAIESLILLGSNAKKATEILMKYRVVNKIKTTPSKAEKEEIQEFLNGIIFNYRMST